MQMGVKKEKPHGFPSYSFRQTGRQSRRECANAYRCQLLHPSAAENRTESRSSAVLML